MKVNCEKFKEGYTLIRYYKDYFFFKKVIQFTVIRNLLEPILMKELPDHE